MNQSTFKFDKINALTKTFDERFLIIGDHSGRLALLDSISLKPVQEEYEHLGAITAISSREVDGYFTALSMDRTISLWNYDNGKIRLADKVSLRNIQPDGKTEPVGMVRSESQAVSIHPHSPYICSRTANGDLALFKIQDDKLYLQNCVEVNSQFDIISCKFTGQNLDIFTGTVRGHIALIQNNKIVFEWKMGDESVHWFEPDGEQSWLLASDARRVGRLSFSNGINESSLSSGPVFALDDFENIHITKDKRVFASSFDRNIYEICQTDLTPVRVVAQLPFKLRWLTSIGSRLIVQCRNGAAYSVDIETGNVIAQARQTPGAFWSAVLEDLDLLTLYGENPSPVSISINRKNEIRITTKKIPIPRTQSSAYTKRAVAGRLGDKYVAEIDGSIYLETNEKVELIYKANGGIRDICFDDDGKCLYFATELGHVGSVCTTTHRLIAEWKSEKPLRSLAFNKKEKILAVSERIGHIVFLDSESLIEKFRCTDSRTAKRMKWIDDSSLVYNYASRLHQYNLKANTSHVLMPAIGNTVEDFTVDHTGRYLLTVNYMREVTLADKQTGVIFDRIFDDIDYSKGIIWLGNTLFARKWGPGCFATFGRTGNLNIFCIYEERLLLVERISCAQHLSATP